MSAGALEQIGKEMLRVRFEVAKATKRHSSKSKYAIYVGRTAEMLIKMDPESLRNFVYVQLDAKERSNKFMGALIIEDYGLPEAAVSIHVDGTAYTTFELTR